MHLNLILGACVAGLQLASANVPQDRKHRNAKTEWVTEIKTVKAHPRPTGFPWLGSWGHHDGKPEHPHEPVEDHDGKKKHHKKPHKGSKDHDDDGKTKKKHRKHRKGSKDSDDNETPRHKHPKGHKKDDDDGYEKTKHHKGKGKHHTGKTDTPHKTYRTHSKTHHTKKPHKTQKPYPDNDGNDAGNYSGITPAAYKSEVVQCHNVHRANHSAPKIAWSDSLAATAAKIAKDCVFQHVMGIDGGHYGQNIAAGVTAAGISHIISDQFYNAEINDFGNQYGEAHPTGFEQWGHFSQLVWSNTDSVGCATQHCPNGVGNTGAHVKPYFTVCNYSPPGNIAGAYGKQIGRPLGRPTVRGHGPNDKK